MAKIVPAWVMSFLLLASLVSAASAQSFCNRVAVDPNDTIKDIIYKAAHVVPSAQQLAWQEMEFIAFVHFGINTFTDREWGDGTEDPGIFNPTAFDACQWAETCKQVGIKMIISTAKHHDGFCLWPSNYTEHSVKNSPWRNGRGDVVRELAQACRQSGLKLGIYLSPWDRHEPTYGDSPRYNEYFKNQLRELLTGYGEIMEVWFDGACGEGPNGKRQEYDWNGYYQVVRELQLNAVIAIVGPDVRWVGNESGVARETEWSVQPAELSTSVRELKWYPAECDVSIRPGWFYHASENSRVKSLDELLDIYYKSIGRNSVLLLNIPPDRRGLIHENDVNRLKELREVLDATFKENLALGAAAAASNIRQQNPLYAPDKAVDPDKNTYWMTDDWTDSATIEFDLGKDKTFNVVMLQEYIKAGQRVEQFLLEAWDGKDWRQFAQGTTIGYKRLLRFADVTTNRVRLRILKSRVCPTICNFGLFQAPKG
jgi:alpha-L-fucosidase